MTPYKCGEPYIIKRNNINNIIHHPCMSRQDLEDKIKASRIEGVLSNINNLKFWLGEITPHLPACHDGQWETSSPFAIA